MASEIHVELGERRYRILIGRNLFERTGELCREAGLEGAALLVSDTNVAPLYAAAVEASLRAAGIRVRTTVIPAGEASKSPDQLLALYRAAIAAELDRSSFVAALGGGVVGDLAGFAAGTFLRGVRYVQIPTSLLAMVDSSVGGKTGIDLPEGKNLVGVFHQPSFVVADLDTLHTLPADELRSGLAEVVKYGAIRDAAFFAELERNAAALLARSPELWERAVAASCRHKADVVARDEREGGLRAILNFGHTLGHALEAATGYRRWRHGEAVALGMVFATWLSVRQAGLAPAEHERLRALLASLALPVCAPGDVAWEDVSAAMRRDKKARGGAPRFVLLERIGRARFGIEAPSNLLKEAWHAIRE